MKLGLFFYFKRISTHNERAIPLDKPVLFLSNHQNALLDALIIATNSKRYAYFLTRAAVFSNPIISRLLKSLQMLPVYRIRDGWNNLSNNSAIFDTCVKLFNKNEAIVIFPEGNHNFQRSVRPLSKGFTRIVFATLEKHPEMDLQLLPVGLNYINAEKFPDSVSLFYGESIKAQDFILENKNEATLELRKCIQYELTKLTTHIPPENYKETLLKLNELNVDFLNPKQVNKTISSNYTKYRSVNSSRFSILKPFFKGLLILLLFAPYLIWKLALQPKIKEIEFMSTFRFAVALTLVPFWVLALVILLTINFSWIIGLGFLLFTLSIALISVKA
ncbi:MAG: glycerol acyltransferase [Flaviramulus sp.]|nr:glycerol acyltransferase [Flaviramulus sp.]